MRLVISLGGSALPPPASTLDLSAQQQAAADAVSHLAPVLADGHQIVLVHGKGPQVGLLALQSAAHSGMEAYPPEVLAAETEGMIGCVLQTEVDRVFDGEILTIATRTVVDPLDPAFDWPTRAIGPKYADVDAAQHVAHTHGWALTSDDEGVRRVVACPDPKAIIEGTLVERLVADDVLVICASGGGVPVTDDGGWVHGVEAIVDKDLAAGLLAASIGADRFVMLTDVDAVIDGWGTDHPRAIDHATPAELRRRRFESASIGPKVEAACRFVESTGGTAAIGALLESDAVVEGRAGTQVDNTVGFRTSKSTSTLVGDVR